MLEKLNKEKERFKNLSRKGNASTGKLSQQMGETLLQHRKIVSTADFMP